MISKSTISSSHIPSAFNGFRIAQVSDLHNAVFGKDNAELLQALSECEPNIIVITGDLVDAEHTDIDIALEIVLLLIIKAELHQTVQIIKISKRTINVGIKVFLGNLFFMMSSVLFILLL